MTDRGVSNVVGFVLVFSLVLSTVVVVYAMGFPGLEQRRDAERVTNAERAFDVLADNVADVSDRGAPARATEIKLAEASLRMGEPSRLTVEITNLGTPAPTFSTRIDPIVYAATGSDTRLVYEAGAVIRVQNDGAVMKRDPGPVFVEDGGTRTAVVPMLQTRGVGQTSVGGSTTVRVRTDLAVAEVQNASTSGGPYDVKVTMETSPDRAAVWEAYLDDEVSAAYTGVSDPCSATGGTVTCTFATDRLFVTATRVDVTFS